LQKKAYKPLFSCQLP